jgi:hypothetical protein
MKEIEDNHADPIPAIVISEEKKKTLVGRLRIRPGQKLFMVNMKEEPRVIHEITAFSKQYVPFNSPGTVKKEIILQENCYYTAAINMKNAKKKLIKLIRMNAEAELRMMSQRKKLL